MQRRAASQHPPFPSLPPRALFHAALISGVLSAVAFRLFFFTSDSSLQPKLTTTLPLLVLGACVGALVGGVQWLRLQSVLARPLPWLAWSVLAGAIGALLVSWALVAAVYGTFLSVTVLEMGLHRLQFPVLGETSCRYGSVPAYRLVLATAFGTVLSTIQLLAHPTLGMVPRWHWVLLNALCAGGSAFVLALVLDTPTKHFGCGIVD